MNAKKKYKKEVLEHLKLDDNFGELTKKLDLQTVPNNKRKFMKKGIIFVTGGVCLALIVGVGTYVIVNQQKDQKGSAMITMNLNPSIRFLVDSDHKVISVSGENNEGKMIIAGEVIVGQDLNAAIELVLKVENETGYLISGNASLNENQLSFSITTDSAAMEKALKNEISTTVEEVCDELNIQESLSYLEAYSREQLETIVLYCDSALTKDQVEKMSYEQLFNVIKLYSLETAELYSVELEELYNQTKAYEIKFSECQFTRDAISSMGSIYNVFMQGYDRILESLKSSINTLNDLQYECFVSESSMYQIVSNQYAKVKEEILKYKKQLAEIDSNDIETKEAIQNILAKQISVIEELQDNMQTIKENAENSIASAISLIDSAIVHLEEYKDNLPGQENIEKILSEKVNDLDQYLNTKKTTMFEEFEKNYSDDIQKMKENVLAYKEQLKNSIKE